MLHLPVPAAAPRARRSPGARHGSCALNCLAPSVLPSAADDATLLRVSTLSSVADVSAAEWDACAMGGEGGSNPFVSHGFLALLESSGSAAPHLGWQPLHTVVRDASGVLVGCVPSYLKMHSYGEYVFDGAWANAFSRAGGRYYPKLQACVPFSPVTGPRLLVRPGAPAGTEATLVKSLAAVADELRLSSAHVTFPSGREAAACKAQGWLLRTGVQYHWQNKGYASFADFEAALKQSRRKTVRQERKHAATGLRISRLRGGEITPRHWQAFYSFYVSTVEKHWGTAYLQREFFDSLGSAVGDAALLVVAETDEPGGGGEVVAGALNLVGSDCVFGRNWGCAREYPALHFEMAYYQAIEEAIERRLGRVEAGAQGEHKISRGYLPTTTYSAHYIREPSFRSAVASFLDRERVGIEDTKEMLSERSPYKDVGEA